jgi:hypothetical protein
MNKESISRHHSSDFEFIPMLLRIELFHAKRLINTYFKKHTQHRSLLHLVPLQHFSIQITYYHPQ